MNCKTIEDMNAAVEHGDAINETHPDQVKDTTVGFLATTKMLVAKINGFYQVKTGGATIKQSVTEKVSKELPFNGPENKLLEQQADIGTFGHSVSEYLMQQVIDVTNTLTNDKALAYVKNHVFDTEGLKKIFTDTGKTLDAKSIQNASEGIRDLLLMVYKQQRTINTLSGKEGTATIVLEQIVLDPKRNIGGTIDCLVLYSDNTAGIIDYKTKIISPSNTDAFGNIIDPAKVVTDAALKRYKLQMFEYGRILREAYGVKTIRSVHIIPIKVNVKLDSKKGKYANKITGLAFPGQDPLLEKVLPFSNATNFKSLDEFIRSIDVQLEKLERRIKSDPSRRDELNEKIDKLNQSRLDILTQHNMDTILKYGQDLADSVNVAEAGNLGIKELQELIEELQLLASLSEATVDYRKFLKNTTKKQDVDNFEQKVGLVITQLNDKIDSLKEILFNDKVTALVESYSGFKITDDYGNFIPMAQEGYFGKWFYQLSQYDNPIFQSLRKILDEINYSTRLKTEAVVEEIVDTENKVYAWLKSTGRSFEDLIEIMINPEKDNFWGKYAKAYFDEIDAASPENIHKYYAPSDNHEEWFTNKVIELIDKYTKEGLSKDEVSDKIKDFTSKNSLEMDGNSPKYPDAWFRSKRYNRLHLKDNPKDYNDKYKFIMSVPELKAYYEMFEKYNKEFRDLLGVDYNQLPNSFLPNIRKTMAERVSEQGFSGFLDGTQDFFKDFSVREEDKSEDSSYNSNDKIPIFFLNPFRNKDNSLQIGEKSYQFGRSLAIFAKMAYNYDASTAREAEILALQQFLSEEAEQLVQSRGKNLIDKMGNPLTEKLQATDLPEIFKSFVDMYIYKIGVKPILGDKSGEIEKKLLKAKEYFTLKALGLNVVAGFASFTSAKINAMIESNKGIIFNSTNYKESMLASWSDREKFLAMNAYFDPMSHRLNNPVIGEEKQFGERQYGDPTMRGWVKKYVNSRMLMNVFSVGDQYIEELVLVAMSKNYYVDESGNVKRIKNDADMELHKDRLVWNLFEYDKETGPKLKLTKEQMGNAFESFRRAVQAGQSRIKGTIAEEDKAHWQNNIIMQLVMHFKSWMPGIMFERFGKVKFDNRIDSVYMGKYIALGKEFSNPDKLAFTIFFKKILLPKLGNLAADVATLGLLKSRRLNDRFNKQLAFNKWLDENPHYKGKVTFEEFNEVQQKQLKSIIQELRVLLLLAGLILLMGMDWDDDGEKDYKKYLLTRKLASAIFKTQQEMSFVFDPTSFASMVKTPLPMIGLVNDVYKTLANTVDEILDIPFGEERLIGGTTNDKQPLLFNTHKWMPGLGGLIRFLDVFNDDVSYSKTQQ